MVMPRPIDEQSDIEAFRDRIRQMPGVIVRRPDKPVPYTPWIRVTGNVDIRELLGRRDDDQDEDDCV